MCTQNHDDSICRKSQKAAEKKEDDHRQRVSKPSPYPHPLGRWCQMMFRIWFSPTDRDIGDGTWRGETSSWATEGWDGGRGSGPWGEAGGFSVGRVQEAKERCGEEIGQPQTEAWPCKSWRLHVCVCVYILDASVIVNAVQCSIHHEGSDFSRGLYLFVVFVAVSYVQKFSPRLN